jgi:hypothetical protein
MQATEERRALGSNRIPFDALVEIGEGEGNGFEAQAVDISPSGMHLRTAYLPDIGQMLSCRFEMASGTVVSEGQVIWKQDAEQGGEFGLQFVSVDPQSEAALMRAFAQSTELAPGTKVRLHIDGLGAPMRARVRTEEQSRVTATSDLAFLRLGNALELEDAVTGNKRPAQIRGVEVEMDANSHIPKLVVSMRYSDADTDELVSETSSEDAHAEQDVPHDPKGRSLGSIRAMATSIRNENENEKDEDGDGEGEDLKSPVARALSKVTPALLSASQRAKDSVVAFMDKRSQAKQEATETVAPRRTTAPPPNGGLHTAGRRVVRDAAPDTAPKVVAALKSNKRSLAIGSAVLCMLGLGYAGMHKSDPAPSDASHDVSATSVSASTLPAAPAVPATPAAPVIPMAPGINPALASAPMTMPQATIGASAQIEPDVAISEDIAAKAAPFGHGNVTGGKVLRIKMDGNITRIQGAMQPTGFTVVVPKRKSVTASASLLKQDKRFHQVSVSNEGNGAEINVSFKDGVPPYLVRAKGDTLEVVLGKSQESDELTRPELKRASAGGHRKHDVKHNGKKKHHRED